MNYKELFTGWFFYSASATLISAAIVGSNSAWALDLPAVDCVITPSKSVDLSVATSGVIRHIHAERSEHVKAGQLLVELNSRVEEANLNLAKLKANMKAEISAEEINLRYDRLQNERVRNLQEKKLVSGQNIDESKRSEQVSYWRLQQAKDTYAVRQLELERAAAQLDNTRVFAPFDGVVTQVYKSEGEYVEDSPVMQLVQLNPLHVEAVLGMEYFGQIHNNMLGDVYPETNLNTPYSAHIEVVDPVGDTASGTFGVRLTMDNPGNHIVSGVKCILKLSDALYTEPNNSEQAPSDTASASEAPLTDSAKLPASATSSEESSKESMTQSIELSGGVIPSYKFGPFASDKEQKKAAQIIESYGFDPQRVDADFDFIKGYLVLSADSYRQPSSQLLAQFGRLGVKDMMVMPQKTYQGRISFGAYNGPQSANMRQAALTRMGIKSEVVARTEKESATWLAVESINEAKREAILQKLGSL
ncbi:efflux RND transporter periplasmic adaptor subunit [Neptunomonas phycophila]|uniref:efflux RND transporter periplasmic adaptor subunit n=1 Tax=Neptunomonas phycophila TaxID=1572645 RepID=UPI000948BD52|nr:efflux RND transporter periplasmic adaptor subunit [Neptunomonas phycophila]